ncbi:MAG TPA: hypothetical protein DD811_05355 [Syntrophomonas sp.]|jgi:hypothetical protein|nr:hypothetical protein [Syntrophomonas sp.]
MWEIAAFTRDLASIEEQTAVSAILETNLKAQKYGLALSEKDAREIMASRNYVLKSLGRVELGIDVINKIISVFCTSPYINQSDYTVIINDLVEGFYYMKNETRDKVDDDDLIALMKKYFDDRCHGSVELLLNRELGTLARYIREGRL